MNKGELVDAIANDANLSKADAEHAVNAFVSAVLVSVPSNSRTERLVLA